MRTHKTLTYDIKNGKSIYIYLLSESLGRKPQLFILPLKITSPGRGAPKVGGAGVFWLPCQFKFAVCHTIWYEMGAGASVRPSVSAGIDRLRERELNLQVSFTDIQ